MERLDRYREMRDFTRTPEPEAAGQSGAGGLRFSMQKHDATRLHWDLRLEWDGALLSWAVTRGPSLDPAQKRLAVRTEDHPLSYLEFEGAIPEGNYGAGTVMLWDLGWWMPLTPMPEALGKGLMKLRILGRRLTGDWMLVRMKEREKDRGRENWLMVKERDAAVGAEEVLTETALTSVATRRTMEAIAAEAAEPKAAQTGRRPAFRKPQLATLREDPPEAEGWWAEPKHDGYRAQILLGRGGPKVVTRNGHDWTDRFGALLPWLADLPCAAAAIDVEVVAGLGPERFGRLQDALSAGGPLAAYAFDLLHLDGRDLAPEPLGKRRDALEGLMAEIPTYSALRLSPVVKDEPKAVLEAICASGGEGIVAKRIDAPYRGRRTQAWIKVKCGARAEFVIAGYQPSSSPGRPFASLLMATRDDGRLTYRGKVGTGFDEAAFDRLAAAMEPLRRKSAPFAKRPDEVARNTVWLDPLLVAEVNHAELTESGRIRHGVFLGLREDKPARTVRLERAEDDPGAKGPVISGIRLSSPRRKVFPEAGVTKERLAQYYEEVADRFLAEAANRPVSLLRHPGGLREAGFFQRHAGEGFPDAIGTLPVKESDGKTEQYMYVSTPAGIIGAVQMGTIEFHIWGAHRDRIERPDRMVFDLDPDEALGFDAVRGAAEDIRDILQDFGLPSQALVTGGKGVHVVVTLRRTAGWDTVKGFARTFATLLAAREPERYVATMSKAKRKGRIFIDWLRNERSATAIAPFSVRARPGAKVAVPVGWDELARLDGADAFGLDAAEERVAEPAPKAVTLGAKVVERLEAWSGSG